MVRPMKIYIQHFPDDPKASISEAPWYLNPAFEAKEFEVEPQVFDKNGTGYYKMLNSEHNRSVFRILYLHLSNRMRNKLSGSMLNSVYIEARYAMPTGRSNRDFLFLLNPKEDNS